MNELEHFRRVAGDPPFREWLLLEKEKVLRFLASGEGVALHRAQGRFQLLTEIQELLEKAKSLR